jgi:hypothetical protein
MPRADRCSHGAGWPCPWPGCAAGVAGAQRVVAGPGGLEYFVRALDVTAAGELVVRWTRRDEEAAAPPARRAAA